MRPKNIEDLEADEYTVWAHRIEGYNFFKATRPLIKKTAKINRHIYSKVISEFYKKVAHYIVECSDGVHIDGLGYFGSMIYSDTIPTSRPVYHENFESGVPLIYAHTDGKMYCLCFVHDKYYPISRTFLPDYTFSMNLKREFIKALYAGQKYRFNATLFV